MHKGTIAILAGGLATRLRPVTEQIPKSLLEVAGKPFIEHQIDLLKRNKISDVIICAGYLGKMIEDAAGDGDRFGIRIRYSYDGDKLLGTGGAILNAMDMLGENFFVMYGDSYLDTDFQKINEYFFSSGKKGLMTVFRNEGKWDKSNVVFTGGKIVSYDKSATDPEMKYIDYGLGILTKRAFDNFRDRKVFQLEEVYAVLIREGELAGFEVKERFYETGSFAGLKETSEYLLRKRH